ncbi:MAG: NUDIX domain-containing protein, partial [Chloroflexota bacterium]|nr:NUDIX domain-containing protein [Chloroflexota bacterium]
MVKKSKTRVETLVSAGGVVYRQREGRVETVLCGHWITSNAGQTTKVEAEAADLTEDARWSLAKGTPDAGETMEETALREVREE